MPTDIKPWNLADGSDPREREARLLRCRVRGDNALTMRQQGEALATIDALRKELEDARRRLREARTDMDEAVATCPQCETLREELNALRAALAEAQQKEQRELIKRCGECLHSIEVARGAEDDGTWWHPGTTSIADAVCRASVVHERAYQEAQAARTKEGPTR